jgi:hypothetical protein
MEVGKHLSGIAPPKLAAFGRALDGDGRRDMAPLGHFRRFLSISGIPVRSLLLGFALGSGAGLLSACGSNEDGAALEPAGQRVVIGTGRSAYEPLLGEPEVPLISGIQGGFHVWSSFIAYGFDTSVLRMELKTSSDGLSDTILEQNGNVSVRPALDPEGAPVLSSFGWPASIYDPRCANGRRLRVDLTVRDQVGHSASDTKYCIVDVAEEYRATDCTE